MFSGTLRSNLDPFGLYDDARLWEALKRAALVTDNDDNNKEKRGTENETASASQDQNAMITLDATIEDEGGNLSVGQRSLVSLARALVKDSPIVLLDEATGEVTNSTQ